MGRLPFRNSQFPVLRPEVPISAGFHVPATHQIQRPRRRRKYLKATSAIPTAASKTDCGSGVGCESRAKLKVSRSVGVSPELIGVNALAITS